MTVASTQADRFHRARVEFVEAMEAGCTIIELRQRAQQSVREATPRINGRQGHVIIDEAASFGLWDSPWMMRD